MIYLHGAQIVFRSVTEQMAALSVTKTELLVEVLTLKNKMYIR